MIDVDALLQPISDEAPTGVDLRWVDTDSTFATIEENRVDEDPALVFDRDPKSADWKLVVSTAEQALTEQSKDLQLAVWLTEGLAAREGFRGVEVGLRLTKELLDQFWDGLHPGYDADSGDISLAIRAKPLSWLTSDLGFVRAVKEVPIANASHTWNSWERAQRVDAASPDDQQEMLADGGMRGADWLAYLQAMDPGALEELSSALQSCEDLLRELVVVCDERFGDDDSPHLGPLQNLVEEIRERIAPLVVTQSAETGGEEVDPWADDGEQAIGPPPTQTYSGPVPVGPPVAQGAIASRQDALQRLAAVAAYFRQTEPHSPMALLIERAVRWGNMSFQQLFSEVVRNDAAQAQVWEILGLDPDAVDTSPPIPDMPVGAPAQAPNVPTPQSPPRATGGGDEDGW